MSPGKQKSNERQAARDRKVLSPQALAGGSSGSTSAYNPVSGTFHSLDSISSEDSGAGCLNGRFKSIDDVDDNSSSNGGGTEMECMSNTGSCSGESEDQPHGIGKDKTGNPVLQSGLVGSSDKRDKIRVKNERKHQRQKERRAQELRDKCTSYLMSRRLEALSQQLVGMGFSQERATMSLIVNDGHIERSVAWILEGGEGQVHEDWNIHGNSKIDISEELARMAEIEKKYKFTRQEIERAVISCEGDLEKALDFLRVHGRDMSTSPGEGHNATEGAVNDVPAISKDESIPSTSNSLGTTLLRANLGPQPAYQTRNEDKGVVHYVRGRPQGSVINVHASQEHLTKDFTHARKLSNCLTSPQNSFSPADTRGYVQGANPLSTSQNSSLPYIPTHAAGARTDSGLMFGSSATGAQLVHIPVRSSFVSPLSKELVVAGQSPHFFCTSSQSNEGTGSYPVPSSPAFSSSSWGCGYMDSGSPSSVHYVNSASGNAGLKGLKTVNSLAENLDPGVADMQGHYVPLGSVQSESLASRWASIGNRLLDQKTATPLSREADSSIHSRSSSITSYGLYTGWGTRLSHSSVDWSTGPVANCDYRNIDWSMSVSPSSATGAGGLWGLSSSLGSLKLQEKGSSGWNFEKERQFQAMSGNGNLIRDSPNGLNGWKVGPSVSGVHEITREPGNTTTFVHEWTTPFAGKDLFTPPRAVPSPSL